MNKNALVTLYHVEGYLKKKYPHIHMRAIRDAIKAGDIKHKRSSKKKFAHYLTTVKALEKYIDSI